MASMFHLFTHAMFKALLFLCAGAIIHAVGSNENSMMHGLHKHMPITSFAFLIGCLAISGIPPFAGFFSKFFIFVGACHQGSVAIYALVLIALVNTIISLYYYLLVVKAMFIRQDDCVIPRFQSHWTERAGMILCVLGIIFIGLVSCIYASINGAVDAIGAMFAAVQ